MEESHLLPCHQLSSIGSQLLIYHLQIYVLSHQLTTFSGFSTHILTLTSHSISYLTRQPNGSSSDISQVSENSSSRTQSPWLVDSALRLTLLRVSSSQFLSPLPSSPLFCYGPNFLTGFHASTLILYPPPFMGMPKWFFQYTHPILSFPWLKLYPSGPPVHQVPALQTLKRDTAKLRGLARPLLLSSFTHFPCSRDHPVMLSHLEFSLILLLLCLCVCASHFASSVLVSVLYWWIPTHP